MVADEARSPEAAARLTVAQLGARVILDQLDRAHRHEAGARTGDDPEELHKMRVATRRMRVALAVFGDALAVAGADDLPVKRVKEVADALGAVRDLDVFIEWLDDQVCRSGDGIAEQAALARLRSERVARRALARERLLCVLDGPAQAEVDAARPALETIAGPPESAPDRNVPKKARVGRAGKRPMKRALERLERRGATLFAPTSGELHRVRIAAKRFRYVCEFLRPAFESRAAQMDGAIERATAIQDALGELRDAEVSEAALLDDVVRVGRAGAGEDAAAIAGLIAAQRARREAALLRFREEWERRPRKGWLKQRPEPAAEKAGEADVRDAGAPGAADDAGDRSDRSDARVER